jgi:FlaA1/EpsC-like NDP-sugar epimerase
MKYNFQNKVVLVSVGTGEFLGMLATYLLDTDVNEVIVFSRDEKKQEDMRRAYADPRMECVIVARHCEKMHESLFLNEKISTAIDCKDYYRVPGNLRSYDYIVQNENDDISNDEYASYNKHLLNDAELDKLLANQQYIKAACDHENIDTRF